MSASKQHGTANEKACLCEARAPDPEARMKVEIQTDRRDPISKSIKTFCEAALVCYEMMM